MKIIGKAAKTSFYYKKESKELLPWDLIYKIKCKSTEIELDKYLKRSLVSFKNPISIIAREQFSGIGQYKREWDSPPGGIWLSAAYPIFSNEFLPEIYSLSIANKLCEMFREESITVDLKWPNDIYFGQKKIIGFLPKVIIRGSKILYVRVGIGMNLNNHTPLEGISLSKALKRKNLCEYRWTSKLLKVICKAVESNSRKMENIQNANKFLNKNYLPKGYDSSLWLIKHIDWNGNLIMIDKKNEKILKL